MTPLEQIAAGLEELRGFVREHPGPFDLADGRGPNQREHERLKWLADALGNFMRRGARLYFVGFLGHYNSGKSSTINSLMEHRTPDEAEGGADTRQPTGRHPTTLEVTLITDPENLESLRGLETGGFADAELVVPVRLKGCPRGLFGRVVLMDTPGSGDVPGTVDPARLDEVVREFLPLCDLLVYCFNATQMLDSADMPLLLKKQAELPDVPMLFVITRADDFRRDHNRPIDLMENYDSGGVAADIERLRDRIEQALARAGGDRAQIRRTVRDAPVVPVSNLAERFGIDELAAELGRRAGRHFDGGHQHLNAHKLRYFRDRSRQKWHWAHAWLAEQTRKAAALNDAVARGHDGVRANLKFVVREVESRWRDALGRIESAHRAIARPLPDAAPARALGAAALDDAALELWRASALKDVELIAGRWAETAAGELRGAFARLAREKLHESADGTDPASPFAEPMSVPTGEEIAALLDTVPVPPVCLWDVPDLATAAERLRDGLAGAVRALAEVHHNCLAFVGTVLDGDPAGAYEGPLLDARTNLRHDVADGHYFALFESFREAVGAHPSYAALADVPALAERLRSAFAPFDGARRSAHLAELSDRLVPADRLADLAQGRDRFVAPRLQLAALRTRVPADVAEPIRLRFEEVRAALSAVPRDGPDGFTARAADRLRKRHTAAVAELHARVRPAIRSVLDEVRQDAESARRAWVDARNRADEDRHRAERAEADLADARLAAAAAEHDAAAARRSAERAAEQAPLARDHLPRARAEQTRAEADARAAQLRAEQLGGQLLVRARLAAAGVFVVVLVAFGYVLSRYSSPPESPPDETLVERLLRSGLFLVPAILTAVTCAGALFKRHQLVQARAEARDVLGGAQRARASVEKAADAIESAERELMRCESRLIEAETRAEHQRGLAERAEAAAVRCRAARDESTAVSEACRAELAELIEVTEQSGPPRFAEPVLARCRALLEAAFAPYLHGDCGITETARALVREDLTAQLDRFLASDLIREGRRFRGEIERQLGECAELWRDVGALAGGLWRLCTEVLAFDGDRCPQAVFEGMQAQLLRPALDLVRTHAEGWANLARQFDALADRHAPALAPE